MNQKTIFTNLLWRFLERCGAQGVKFIVELILARLLLPDDYGLIALISVFIMILEVFVDSGLGNALIQKKDVDDIDFSTVFYFNVIWCIFLYFLLFFSAPYISSFYGKGNIISVLRVLGIQIIVSGIKNVQIAYVSRTMQFRKFFFSTLGGTLGAAIIGIYIAYTGGGIWALVTQQLFNMIIDTTILWITVKWRPNRKFSLYRLKSLLSYGWKLMTAALLDTIYNNLQQLLIGKIYTSADLAYYNKGNQFPHLIVSNINSSIDSVLLPTLASEQDNVDRVRYMTRKAITISVYIMAPLMIGLIVISKPLIRLILTEKWSECALFLRIFCVSYIFYPIHTANLNAIKALGRSDLFLKLEIIKKIIALAIIISTMWFGVYVMALSTLLISLLSQIINSWPNKKLMNYSYLDQIYDILPSILLSIVMGVCIFPIKFIKLPDIPIVIIQVFLGGSIYLKGSKLLNLDPFSYLIKMKDQFKKNHS